MIDPMRTWRRRPSRPPLRRASQERGKPAAALAIIATIFATALIIRLLPSSARQALLLETPELPSRALVIWSAGPEPVSARAVLRFGSRDVTAAPVEAWPQPLVNTLPQPVAASLPGGFAGRSAEREGGPFNPAQPPVLSAASFLPVALPEEIIAMPAGIEIESSNSPLVMPFAKTGSALRFAFVKTGGAIKAAASGTAGVFVSNP